MTEDEVVGWHHRLNGHGVGWTLVVGDGQGGLACFGSRGPKESDTTVTELNRKQILDFPGGSVVKNLTANTEDVGSIPGSERSPREGNGNPF